MPSAASGLADENCGLAGERVSVWVAMFLVVLFKTVIRSDFGDQESCLKACQTDLGSKCTPKALYSSSPFGPSLSEFPPKSESAIRGNIGNASRMVHRGCGSDSSPVGARAETRFFRSPIEIAGNPCRMSYKNG